MQINNLFDEYRKENGTIQSASMAALQSLREVAQLSLGSPEDGPAFIHGDNQSLFQSPANFDNDYLVQPSADLLSDVWSSSLSGE
jgi:hypothetical protein